MAFGQSSNGKPCLTSHGESRNWMCGSFVSILPESMTSESWKWQLILTADPAGQEQKESALRWLCPSSPDYMIYSTRKSDTWEILSLLFFFSKIQIPGPQPQRFCVSRPRVERCFHNHQRWALPILDWFQDCISIKERKYMWMSLVAINQSNVKRPY